MSYNFRCPNCDGRGQARVSFVDCFVNEHTDYVRCPVCNGTGAITPNLTLSISLENWVQEKLQKGERNVE